MRLDDIAARLEAASVWPWELESCNCCLLDNHGEFIVRQCSLGDNGPFIAHAPDDVGWLLARIREAAELHQRTEGDPDGLLGDNPWPRCTCGHQWPCRTLRALRGENE